MVDLGKSERKLKKFCCLFSDVNEGFRYRILELFEHLTNPNKVVIKKIGGQMQTCRQLCDYMEVMSAYLNSDTSLDDPQSLIVVSFFFFFLAL